jgi:hypothetical protein
MKVLEKGREQKGWSTETVCTGAGNDGGGCGAKLLVERPDVFYTSKSARDETDYFTTFECPECGALTDLKVKTPFYSRDLPSYRDWKKHQKENKPLPEPRLGDMLR